MEELPKDPYHEAIPSEVALLVAPLNGLKQRVEYLHGVWPEHGALQRILELIGKLEIIPLQAPLMRWLVGIEALLGRAEEWEGVASSEVSLKTELHNISKLVVRWRKLELESWGSMLDRRECDARKKTAQWWLHLHELIASAENDPYWTRPPNSWFTSENKIEPSKESLQVFDTLDQFARSSTLGDFSLRVNLLEAFAGYARANFAGSPTALAATLENLAIYYSQFENKVKDQLAQGRAPLQAKLVDHVKIATWDDRNYFSLRESAEKSHRVIHKLARNFDIVLESAAHPAVEAYANEMAIFETPEDLAKAPPKESRKAPKLKTIEIKGLSTDINASGMSAVMHLKRDLVAVSKKAKSLISNQALSWLENGRESGLGGLEELISDARERLASLTKESPTQLKKRALIDFFVEVKKQGLLDGTISRDMKDARLILATELRLGRLDSGYQELDLWLMRSWSQLTRLRRISSSPDRSPDLSIDEVNRGLKACENLMSMVLKGREVLLQSLGQDQNMLGIAVRRWQLAVDPSVSRLVGLNRIALEKVCNLFENIVVGVGDLTFLSTKLAKSTPYFDVLPLSLLRGEVNQLIIEGITTPETMEALAARCRKSIATLGSNVKAFVAQERIPSCEGLLSLFDGDNLDSILGDIATEDDNLQSNDMFVAQLDALVEKCMIAVQNACADASSDGSDFSSTQYCDRLITVLRQMNIKTIADMMNEIALHARASEQRLTMRLLCPLLHTLLGFYQSLVSAAMEFHSALCGFSHFVLAIFRTLCEKGFCRPPDEEDGGGEQEDDGRTREGTGMGEGEGQKNVSNELEDEEQILGLKGEQEESKDRDPNKKEDEEDEEGMEMENDFEGGDMHDVPQDNEDEEKEEEDQKDGEEEEELDREMGDVGDESQVVDERMWDEEEDEQDDSKEEKYEKDAAMDQKNKDNSDEMRAKTGEDEEKPETEPKENDEKEKDEKKPKNKDKSDKQEAENDEGKINKPEEEEERHDVGEKEVFSSSEDEGQDDGSESADSFDEHEGEEEEDGGMNNELPPDEEYPPEDFEMPKPDLDNMEEPGDEQEASGSEGGSESEESDDDGGDGNEAVNPEEEKPEDQENDAGKASLPAPSDPIQGEEDKEQPVVENDPEKKGNAQGLERQSSGQDKPEQEERPEDADDDQNQPKQGLGDRSQGGQQGNRRERADNPQQEQQQEQNDLDRNEPNPWRDPGEATKQWRRRMKVLRQGAQQQPGEEEPVDDHPEEDDADEPMEVEYKDKRENNDDPNSMQALGPRGPEDEGMDLDLEDEEKEEEKPEEAPPPKKTEEKNVDSNQNEDGNKKKQAPQSKKKRDEKKGFFDDLEEEEDEEVDDKSVNEDLMDVEPDVPPSRSEIPSHILSTAVDPESGTLGKQAELLAEVTQPTVVDVSDDGTPLTDEQLASGGKLWNEAVGATHEMAQRLCEQLRLVLEPTQAAKLKGDYRSGKRINMRRVIPFIASQFRKDKIWLRRTKPSRRKYHVALAIDDSKSMLPARHLALAALALISRALTQLEVGEIGVWSFGEVVSRIHALGQPFSDASGARIAARFGFNQNSTNIEEGLGALVESLTEASEHAPTSSIASDIPKQLAFVISDGRFDSGLRPRMAKWLRTARERKQLIALIVVEPAGGESILELKQVSFTTAGVGGMKVSRYLEDYPFPYYIILRDMAVLPEVLADGLRQWFELVAKEDM